MREEIGAPRTPQDQERFDQGGAEIRSALGGVAFDAAFAEGRALTIQEAITYALNRSDAALHG